MIMLHSHSHCRNVHTYLYVYIYTYILYGLLEKATYLYMCMNKCVYIYIYCIYIYIYFDLTWPLCHGLLFLTAVGFTLSNISLMAGMSNFTWTNIQGCPGTRAVLFSCRSSCKNIALQEFIYFARGKRLKLYLTFEIISETISATKLGSKKTRHYSGSLVILTCVIAHR